MRVCLAGLAVYVVFHPTRIVHEVSRGVLEITPGLLTFALQLVNLPLTLHPLVVGEVAYALLNVSLTLIEHAFGTVTGAAVSHGNNSFGLNRGKCTSVPYPYLHEPCHPSVLWQEISIHGNLNRKIGRCAFAIRNRASSSAVRL